MVDSTKYNSWGIALFAVVFGILVLLSYYLLKPLFSSILVGMLVSYVLYPSFCFTKKYIKKESFAAIFVLLVIIFLVFLPSIFVVQKVAEQTMLFYDTAKGAIAKGLPCIDGETLGCRIAKTLNKFIDKPVVLNYLNLLIQQISVAIVQSISGIALESVNYLFGFIVMLFVSYYGLLEGHHWASAFVNILPVKSKPKFLAQLHSITYSIFYGTFIIAIAEGFLGFLAFFLVGIEPSLFWGTVIAFTAILPFVTATPIWLPACLYMLYIERYVSASILILFGFFIFWADNFLRSYLVGFGAKVHPLLILIGFFGGVQLFGFSGILLGPFILSLLILLLRTYLSENFH